MSKYSIICIKQLSYLHWRWRRVELMQSHNNKGWAEVAVFVSCWVIPCLCGWIHRNSLTSELQINVLHHERTVDLMSLMFAFLEKPAWLNFSRQPDGHFPQSRHWHIYWDDTCYKHTSDARFSWVITSWTPFNSLSRGKKTKKTKTYWLSNYWYY